MKKLLALFAALSMILALVGCGAPAAPTSEPEPDPLPESSSEPEPEPEPEPVPVEGVVREVSADKIVLTLADGTRLVLDITGLSELDAGLGDTVRAEYTGIVGSAAAARIEVTEKANVTVNIGVVTGIADNLIFMTLEDGTEAALQARALEGKEVQAGDTITIEYVETEDEVVIRSVEVTKAAGSEADTAASTTTVPSSASSAGSSQAAVPAASSGGTSSGGGAGTTVSSGGSSSGGTSSASNDGRNLYWWLEDWLEEHPEFDQEAEDDKKKPGPAENAGDVYEAIRLINAERAKEGLPALEADPDLMEMAQVRADEQPASFGHTRPDGSDWLTIFADFGFTYHKCCENAGAGKDTAAKQVVSWMNSPGHKANILREGITKIGVAYCYDANSQYKHYWIMIGANSFDSSSQSQSPSGSSSKAEEKSIDVEAYAYEVVALANAERSAAGLSEVPIDSTLMELAALRAEELEELWSHTRPNGESDALTGLPDYEWLMFNNGMGYTSPAAVVVGWMNSTGHRNNIFYEGHDRVGAGCHQGADGKLYWTIVYYREGGQYPGYPKLES